MPAFSLPFHSFELYSVRRQTVGLMSGRSIVLRATLSFLTLPLHPTFESLVHFCTPTYLVFSLSPAFHSFLTTSIILSFFWGSTEQPLFLPSLNVLHSFRGRWRGAVSRLYHNLSAAGIWSALSPCRRYPIQLLGLGQACVALCVSLCRPWLYRHRMLCDMTQLRCFTI